jgi:hypothetical protein
VPRRDGVVSAQAFSPDGRYIACADATGIVMIFRLAERGHVPTLPEVEIAPVPRAAPDGR